MTDEVDLGEFVGAFVAESDELVEVANAALLEIEKAGDSPRPGQVRDLFRALHTIKGLAGMIGVEPIVELAHGLETLVRIADRGGGTLSPAAVDVCLRGVVAITERVRAVAAQRTPAPAPAALLDEIAQLDTTAAPTATIVDGAALVGWTAKLSAAERILLANAQRDATPLWAITFAPNEQLSAAGITIATVRAALGDVGTTIKAIPRAVPGGVEFDLLVASQRSATELATLASTSSDRVVPLSHHAAPVAPESAPRLERAPDEPALNRSIVRVELGRLDELQEQLSQLVVSRFRLERDVAALAATGVPVRALRQTLELQTRQLRELRRAILRVRLVRATEILEPLELLVRSLTRAATKVVSLVIDAGQVELDKSVADRLLPALVHLVRNAIDHAIEPAVERAAAGKPREGRVHVTVRDAGNSEIELALRDDGRGIDRAAVAKRAGRPIDNDETLLAAITTAGFSTRTEASTTSGRGLGMDIVKRIVVDELRGTLRVTTAAGVGTTFVMRLPITISVVEVLSFECASHAFVVPISSVDEVVELSPERLLDPPNSHQAARIIHHRGRAVPVLSLGALLAIGADTAAKAIVTHRSGSLVGFSVDRMRGRHEVVVRPVEDPLVDVPGVVGTTDLGDGRPTLVLDLDELAAAHHRTGMSSRA